MRFAHPDGSTVHLAYCTNVHPAETLEGVVAQLREYCAPVRARLGVPRLGVGLWLAVDAARALAADAAAVTALRGVLDEEGLEVVTLNGFPYQGFGERVVKMRVYQPDWTQPERLEYTVVLARLLAALLPEDVFEGSVSTLPLAWRTPFGPEQAGRARAHLETLSKRLAEVEEEHGRRIRVGLEPEPGCTVETTGDALAALEGLESDRVGVCVDTCHLATSFEDPVQAVAALAASGRPVVKAQLSAALHVPDPGGQHARAALAAFDEPRFLHQTRARTLGGVLGTDDLPAALEGALPQGTPWRAHFHIPLHTPPQPPLTSTLDVLKKALTSLVGGVSPVTRHLEVETYTWQALPPQLRPRDRDQLADGIAAELSLARDLLTDLGLKELP